jgi:2-isopropylmalate synthase
MQSIQIYDSTLRDGAQGEGISFSLEDKIKVVRKLDELGIAYIEAGNPASNPKDLEFFRIAKTIPLQTAKLCAFGSTKRAGIKPEADSGLLSLLEADTPAVTIFGKCSLLHVSTILGVSPEENLAMIQDSILYLKACGREVIFDAEHFFDGCKEDEAYAFSCIQAAADAGADTVVLCDTNGGSFFDTVSRLTQRAAEQLTVPIGIHTHNDTDMAVSNAIAAVFAGATHVQGCMNGFGERCGNANLCSIIPNLQIKRDFTCVPEENLSSLTETSRYISELANVIPDARSPYVGSSAFAHKGGMHVDGVLKDSKTFEHIDPSLVGNDRRFLVSEVSGRSNLLSLIHAYHPDATKSSPETQRILDRLKQLEYEGYQFEAADASVELIIRKELGMYAPFFELDHFNVMANEPKYNEYSSSAIVKVGVDGQFKLTVAEGHGPVNALDRALRKALETFYPKLKSMRLTDFKVRIIDGNRATEAVTRVLIESTDGIRTWTTVGVSSDILAASWKALVDSIEYKLYQDQKSIKG